VLHTLTDKQTLPLFNSAGRTAREKASTRNTLRS